MRITGLPLPHGHITLKSVPLAVTLWLFEMRTLFSKQSWLAEIHPLTLGFCEFLPGEGDVSDVPLEKYWVPFFVP